MNLIYPDIIGSCFWRTNNVVVLLLLVISLENQRNNALLLLWWMIFHHAQWTISLPSQREMRMTVAEDVTAERQKMHCGKKAAALADKRIIN